VQSYVYIVKHWLLFVEVFIVLVLVPLMNITPLLVLVISWWSFRQVDKLMPGGSTTSLTSMHPNFIRGDKQRASSCVR
jgi:hypothetical protein